MSEDKRTEGSDFQVLASKDCLEGAGFVAPSADGNSGWHGLVTLTADDRTTIRGAGIVLSVSPPHDELLALLRPDQALVTILPPGDNAEEVDRVRQTAARVYLLDRLPRISRAQAMDVLSSQSNLAGYLGVIRAAYRFPRLFPLMMTAAGTIPPAKAFVMGVGVAGLQAIATAKRLGAVVSATDVRPATKEQVESLGAKFVFTESDAGDAAYASELSDEAKAKQQALVAETIAKQDVVITTAMIPGRPAPELITEAMVATMKPGSIIVDLAADAGGNCALSRPGEVYTTPNGVTIDAPLRLAASAATTASNLLARNFASFLAVLWDNDNHRLHPDDADEILLATRL
ncbi:MAG: NAD(P)(+) transhydrogenase (Re/Si-specific) subunit alpha [Alphaproteobacteria bacterium]|nr:NAD(P)(+) transhydrogenase (Re/Si-specific) subunit alpha [Alphaproteobacteria bacterium]